MKQLISQRVVQDREKINTVKDETYQLSGHRIDFAELTRQGSAWLGELRILRVYSLEDAITMKLWDVSWKQKGGVM